MADILMIARPGEGHTTPSRQTLWLSPEEFYRQEELARQYDAVLWQAFHSRGKYARLARHADWFCVAIDDREQYVSSAFVVVLGDKWLIEYVMTDPAQQGQGAGSAVMTRIMAEARERGAAWVILNCDPDKAQGKLPAFYQSFGFEKVA